eukprot:2404311-Pleurochrysis_carterae.AAC.1
MRCGSFPTFFHSPPNIVLVTNALNEYATCYMSCYTRNRRNAKWPHVRVLGALGQVLTSLMRIYERLQKCNV